MVQTSGGGGGDEILFVYAVILLLASISLFGFLTILLKCMDFFVNGTDKMYWVGRGLKPVSLCTTYARRRGSDQLSHEISY